MKQKILEKFFLTSHLLLLSIFLAFNLFFTSFAYAENYPLEITNIKPANTRNIAEGPIIPATNRIFRAYPGIEYNIRPAVIGGAWPYKYNLKGEPEGMTIDSFTGEISWPNPQNDSGDITLSVTDSKGATVTATWKINTTTDGFLFVDSKYSGTETGTMSQPFSSIQSLLNNTGSDERHYIVYFRGGNYNLVAHNSNVNPGHITGKYGTNLVGHPYMWIGFPGETVNIDGDERFIQHHSNDGLYFDSLNLSNFTDYGIRTNGSANYATIRRCEWSNIESVHESNENFGYYFASNQGVGYYLTFQDNTFTGYRRTAAAIGSLYHTHKVLIENNLFGGVSENSSEGFSGVFPALAAKYGCDRLTVRANRFQNNRGNFFGTTPNGSFVGTTGIEIYHNLFFRKDGSPGARENINMSTNNGGIHDFYFYRNTVVGDITFWNLDGDNCETNGPWDLKNNIIINSESASSGYTKKDHIKYLTAPWNPSHCVNEYWNCIADIDNLKGTLEDNIIDEDGGLTSSYESYLGTHGHQLGSQIKNHNLLPPNGLNILEQ